MGRGKPFLPDIQTLEALGFPVPGATVLPNEEIKKILRNNDEQIHCNRFKWYNLPRGLTGNMIERILYYRGQGVFMYLAPEERFVFLPFCMNGGIDIYGRYKAVSPLPFNGTAEFKTAADARKSKDDLTRIMTDIVVNVVYDPVDFEEILKNPQMLETSGVILSDYTRQLPQTIIPKYKLTESIINYESCVIPFVNTALSNSTGIGGMRVNGQDEQATVELASRQAQFAALTGMKWIPITSPLDIQSLTSDTPAKAEEFLLAMQSMDNLRLGIHGVENGGLFEKKAHTTDYENSINMGASGFVLRDATWNRQTFATIINSLYGFEVWVEPDEISVGADTNMDGVIGGGADGQTVAPAPAASNETQEESES